jgi:hypothetical protein
MATDAAIQALATRIGNLLGASPEKGAGTVSLRLNAMTSMHSSHFGVVSGQYFDNGFAGAASGTLIGAANRIQLAPYFAPQTFSIDRIGCGVSTAVAASLFKIVIYSANAAGWPDARLYESGDLSGAAAAFVEATLTFTFNAGVVYWLGVRHSSTCTLRTIPVSSARSLGLLTNNATSYATILQRTLTYATAAPSSWAFVNGDRVANVTPPSIRFRAV